MNKQELIGKLKNLLEIPSEIEGSDFDYGHNFGIERAISLAEDLDESVRPIEPKKPVVPQFVADWYEEHKNYFEYNLHSLCVDFHERKLQEDLHEWFNYLSNKPIETLVMMHKFGYEVEKEKLYTVEIPNPDYTDKGKFVLCKNKSGKVFMKWTCLYDWEFLEEFKLTEEEVKEKFDWAWQFAEEVNNNE